MWTFDVAGDEGLGVPVAVDEGNVTSSQEQDDEGDE